nr:ATPase subunit 8 [Guinardia striata]
MPQFDLLSLGAQVFGLLVSFSIFYYYNIEKTIPLYTETKKFRLKKLQVSSKKINLIDSKLSMIKTEDSNNYKNFI